jgi:hypothetical protein
MEDLIGQRSSAYRGVVVDAVAQAAFNEKKWVWVEDKEEGYIAGWIAKENGDQVEVHLNNGQVRSLLLFSTPPSKSNCGLTIVTIDESRFYI